MLIEYEQENLNIVRMIKNGEEHYY